MPETDQISPLDIALCERLNLPATSTYRLGGARAVVAAVDTVSRAICGAPFFALREAERLLDHVKGTSDQELIRRLMRRNGGTQIEAYGLEHVPAEGPVIIASTHPTGIFDFVAHAAALSRLRPDLKVVANHETLRFLNPTAMIPVRVDRQNRALSARATQRAMQAHLEAGGALLIFGSGRVSARKDGRLIEPEWRPGTSRVSASCQVPIIPAALNARNSPYYYRIRAFAQAISGGDENVGARVGSLRYAAEFIDKLGGRFDIHYGAQLSPGTAPQVLKSHAETLVPGLYTAP